MRELQFLDPLLVTVMKRSADFFAVVTRKGQVRYINQAGRQMLGLSLSEDIARLSINDFLNEDSQQEFEELMKQVMDQKPLKSVISARRFNTEEFFDLDFNLVFFESKGVEQPLLLVFGRRLQTSTESERTKAALASKLTLLGEMAVGIAHEINNPLAVADSALKIVAKKIEDPGIVRKIDLAQKSLYRIQKIVNGLKKFSKNSDTLEKSVFSINELLRHSLNLMENRAQKNSVVLRMTVNSGHDPTVYADEIQIEQILINLISNAIDANAERENAWVKVGCKECDDFIEIAVQDSGSGIEDKVLENLFHPFFTTKSVGSGTGLGLSISKGLAQNHGGDLVYELLDGHTCFILKLPKRRS